MKLHFEPDLDYQLAAVEAVCDLFRGQEICRTEFTVTSQALGGQQALSFAENDLGIGNRLNLLDDEIVKNLHDTQLRNGLPPSSSLSSGDFTVEMETGTGKTYVYLRTIFELHKRYGFTKFAIVVPSVAIKEGVYKSLQITAEHFRGLYANTPFDFFIYDSAKLGQVRNFSTSPNIQVMVVTVGAINKFGDEAEAAAEESNESKRREKSKNVMYRPSEKTGGEKPIDLIRATRPILIVDEPQSVDGGLEGRGKKALDRMNPLCTLRYSATHADKYHMVYRLDAVDAYEKKLVKQIEVAAATIEGANNKPFLRLLAVSNKRGTITAKVELDVETKSGVHRTEMSVQDGDLLELTTSRAIYHDCRIGEIRVGKGNELLELRVPGGEHYLKPGEAWGDVELLAVQREMIRRTIKEHLDKEKRLRPQGIKVLSLFFIDAVDKYRQYDGDGNPVKGDYARIFEEEYGRLAKHPDYTTLFHEVDLSQAAAEVHNGYFSIDKKKVAGKTVEVFKDTRGDTKADDDTYNLIMRDKEKLLSFETPLKFIFSHSALREGWDIELPDLLTDLQDRTQLTRRSIGRILSGSRRLDDFKRNPQQFIDLAGDAINRCKRLALVDGIKYQRLGEENFYAQELFEQQELSGYLKNMLMDTEKSVYEHVVYDSNTERDFAFLLEKNDSIKVYAKLPGWFKVPTPLGTYNPDWAVLVEKDGIERLYFVVETKSSLFGDDIYDKERAKIKCGEAHFAALAVGENPVRYIKARNLDDLEAYC
jgi:type III restriction enzyme